MRIIYGVFFAIIYTVGYLFWAMVVTGGGHGNFIGMMALGTWAFNFVALILLTQLKYKVVRIGFVVMMIIYYALLFSTLYEASSDKKMVTHADALALPAVWFLAGQLIIWALFFRKILKLPGDENPEKDLL